MKLLRVNSRTKSNLFTLVDDDVHEWASKLNWSLDKDGYVRRCLSKARRPRGGRRVFYLHRLIMGARPGRPVDHVNGQVKDNRRENLRHASFSENARNRRKSKASCSSRYKGVSWNKAAGKWSVQIRGGGNRRNIGVFDCEQEAARAYDTAALEEFGEFAYLNFPAEGMKV